MVKRFFKDIQARTTLGNPFSQRVPLEYCIVRGKNELCSDVEVEMLVCCGNAHSHLWQWTACSKYSRPQRYTSTIRKWKWMSPWWCQNSCDLRWSCLVDRSDLVVATIMSRMTSKCLNEKQYLCSIKCRREHDLRVKSTNDKNSFQIQTILKSTSISRPNDFALQTCVFFYAMTLPPSSLLAYRPSTRHPAAVSDHETTKHQPNI